MSRCGKFSFFSLLFYNVRVVIFTLYLIIRFISLLHSGMAFELSNTMDASTVDDDFFFYTGQTTCKAAALLNHPFHQTLVAVPGVYNKKSSLLIPVYFGTVRSIKSFIYALIVSK